MLPIGWRLQRAGIAGNVLSGSVASRIVAAGDEQRQAGTRKARYGPASGQARSLRFTWRAAKRTLPAFRIRHERRRLGPSHRDVSRLVALSPL